MTPRLITVLYEDSSAGGELSNFGPHNLLVRCVADDLRGEGLDVEFYPLRRDRFIAVPMNSNSKVQAECTRVGRRLARNGGRVVAIYDLDKVHQLVPDAAVRGRRCKGEMRETLRRQSDAAESLRVYFLDRNVETLTTAVGGTRSGKPKPAERDSLLNPIALAEGDDALQRRRQLRESVPSFDYIVRKVAKMFMPPIIRLYQPSDRDAMHALIEAVLIEFGLAQAVGGVERDLQEIEARYGAEGAGFWVADDEGRVVGTVAVRPKEGRTCELKRLYLRPDQRGAGVGQRLYAQAEAFARGRGYDTIWLDSSRRFGRAHRLYERNGFVLRARLDNESEDNVYEKRLT